jgi:signal peptidase I
MVEAENNQGKRRSYAARIGITALNLILPGLGLLRLGQWRNGILALLMPFPLLILFTFGMGHFPITSHESALFALGVISCLTLAVYIVPAALTWRASRFHSTTPILSRWYSLTAIAIATLFLMQLVPPLMHNLYKPFYAPSESMAPTINKGDKFIADIRWRGPFRRGDVVLFNGPDNVRVYRIAAIAGDKIAMRSGVVILNGTAVAQLPEVRTTVEGYDGLQPAAKLAERLPDEAMPHSIIDMGPSVLDNMTEVVVPANHIFVLGDNRDLSADSRVPPAQTGVGLVPTSAVIGRPMYIHWSSDRAKIGRRLDN